MENKTRRDLLGLTACFAGLSFFTFRFAGYVRENESELCEDHQSKLPKLVKEQADLEECAAPSPYSPANDLEAVSKSAGYLAAGTGLFAVVMPDDFQL